MIGVDNRTTRITIQRTTGHSSVWLERTVRDREVGGSNPLAPTEKTRWQALPAGRLLHLTGMVQDLVPTALSGQDALHCALRVLHTHACPVPVTPEWGRSEPGHYVNYVNESVGASTSIPAACGRSFTTPSDTPPAPWDTIWSPELRFAKSSSFPLLAVARRQYADGEPSNYWGGDPCDTLFAGCL